MSLISVFKNIFTKKEEKKHEKHSIYRRFTT